MMVAAAMIAEDILQGVGDPRQRHREQGGVTMHTRQKASRLERDEFIKRKDNGDYKDRLVAKGIV